MRHKILLAAAMCIAATTRAQQVQWIQSRDGHCNEPQKALRLENKAAESPALVITGEEQGYEFRHWGTTFNEQDWRALQMLTRDEQDEILSRLFAPDGELRFSRGRIGMNANDYALEWWSCDEVEGDFRLEHFTIERDRQYIIPYIRAAQKYCPQMTFWISPWSPPSWMKINHHYAVQSSQWNDLDPRTDWLLFGDNDRSDNEQVNPDKRLFPRRLATNDYFIQEPRYLQAYANYFCRFIEEYGKEGVPITMVMYQNEAYSYTAYPGCPWTVEGIRRFNLDYLAPTLKAKHPEVSLYLGTFNTNRYDHVEEVLNDTRWPDNIKGIGLQWEGRQILPRLRENYPQYDYISTESECGNGSMDWRAGEHTFWLINQYLKDGCSEYYNWNAVLADRGESRWGWRQNGLVQVNSQTRTYRYTPEYYAYYHYSHFLPNGSRIVAADSKDGVSILAARTPKGQMVVAACNGTGEERSATIALGKKYLNTTLPAHSFHTFVVQKNGF